MSDTQLLADANEIINLRVREVNPTLPERDLEYELGDTHYKLLVVIDGAPGELTAYGWTFQRSNNGRITCTVERQASQAKPKHPRKIDDSSLEEEFTVDDLEAVRLMLGYL